MYVSVLIAAALLVPQEAKEAEALYKKMEEKLAAAKTIQLKVSGSAPMAGGEMTFESTVFVGEENRGRIDSELKTPRGQMKFRTISNGAVVFSEKVGSNRTTEATATLRADLVRALARAGGLFTAGWFDVMSEKDSPTPQRKKIPTLTGFRMGKKEKVGDREAQSIEYTAQGLESGEVPVALWIDVETGLPLKRELRGLQGQAEMKVVETYRDLKVNEKIDAATFEIPKENK
jgi:outer membrane lipoprotein-sorting protein